MQSLFPWKRCQQWRQALGVLIVLFLRIDFLMDSVSADVEIGADGSTKMETTDKESEKTGGQLQPSDLPPPQIFTDFSHNTTFDLPNGKSLAISPGSVQQVNARVHTAGATDFTVLPGAMDSTTIIPQILDLLRSYQHYDQDPDTVDGMPTYELFVEHPELNDTTRQSYKVLDRDPQALPERRRLRQQLQSFLRPVLEETLTPYVRTHFADACQQRKKHAAKEEEDDDDDEIDCYPCYSLIRRYRHGERQSHATHHDLHALVTAVVSLSSHGIDYEGGLYVATAHGPRQFLALQAGDAVVHQSLLLHGVQVLDLPQTPDQTERWSWIVWYSDSKECRDNYSYQWFAECSAAGHPTCQQLHATHIGADPAFQNDKDALVRQIVQLVEQAALGGDGTAAVKMARAYLKQLPSDLPRDVAKAKEFYEMAIDSGSAEGHYGLADLYIRQSNSIQRKLDTHKDSSLALSRRGNGALQRAVWHLEQGAIFGNPFSMFNLGIAHIFGYGMEHGNMDVAVEWFVQSGLPEGYYAASISVKDPSRKKAYEDLARALGHYESWRVEFRGRGGSGGAGGVDLNMKWPRAKDGRSPPKF
jgi:hypothetical protein